MTKILAAAAAAVLTLAVSAPVALACSGMPKDQTASSEPVTLPPQTNS